MSERKKRTTRRGAVVEREIRIQQNSTDLISKPTPMRKYAKWFLQEGRWIRANVQPTQEERDKAPTKVSADAVLLLTEAMEHFIVRLMLNTNIIAARAKRVTAHRSDICLALDGMSVGVSGDFARDCVESGPEARAEGKPTAENPKRPERRKEH